MGQDNLPMNYPHNSVVDDEPFNQDVLQGQLQDRYQMRAVSDGDTALKAATKNPIPDLILLDLLMPGMDGKRYDFCSHIAC